ncbi:signal peptidase I [Pseudoneobacillus sp. C159]
MFKSGISAELKSWMFSLSIALGLVLIVRTFIFAPYIVEGASMEPTLHNQEKIFVSKIAAVNGFHRGEIVIIEGDVDNYVKRIIGIPGDKIEVRNDQLFINGKVVEESYLSYNREVAEQMGLFLTDDIEPITVPANHYYVMGDNRLVSMDSRNGLGLIKKDDIVGKLEFVYYPFSEFRSVK